MRALSIFIAGIAAGLGVQFAIAQSPNSDVVRVNHVGLAVPDLDAAVTYYTEKMGFPEVFRVDTPTGDVALVYVQVSENTFVEIQPVNENRPQGISHFGVHVDNMDNVIDMYRSRGVEIEDSRLSSTNAILSNIYDPWGIRMELAELPPESLHRQAMDAWR